MSMYQLNHTHFSKNGGSLNLNIDGASLVMFTSVNCEHCKHFENEFKMLPNSVTMVNFAICNLDGANRQIAQMSKGTTSPIESVPCFIFYSNGIPTAIYKGKRTRNDIVAFLREMMQNHQASFAHPPRPQQQQMPQQGFQQQSQRMPQPPQPQQMPRPPQQQPQGFQQQQQQQPKYTINPNTEVKEYETSYGLPHNAVNEAEFLKYEEEAYKNSR